MAHPTSPSWISTSVTESWAFKCAVGGTICAVAGIYFRYWRRLDEFHQRSAIDLGAQSLPPLSSQASAAATARVPPATQGIVFVNVTPADQAVVTRCAAAVACGGEGPPPSVTFVSCAIVQTADSSSSDKSQPQFDDERPSSWARPMATAHPSDGDVTLRQAVARLAAVTECALTIAKSRQSPVVLVRQYLVDPCAEQGTPPPWFLPGGRNVAPFVFRRSITTDNIGHRLRQGTVVRTSEPFAWPSSGGRPSAGGVGGDTQLIDAGHHNVVVGVYAAVVLALPSGQCRRYECCTTFPVNVVLPLGFVGGAVSAAYDAPRRQTEGSSGVIRYQDDVPRPRGGGPGLGRRLFDAVWSAICVAVLHEPPSSTALAATTSDPPSSTSHSEGSLLQPSNRVDATIDLLSNLRDAGRLQDGTMIQRWETELSTGRLRRHPSRDTAVNAPTRQTTATTAPPPSVVEGAAAPEEQPPLQKAMELFFADLRNGFPTLH